MTTILLEFAIRTTLIAAGTAVVLWIVRIRTASVRHAAWSAVVVTMLVLPLAMAGGIRMSLPVLTPAESTNVSTSGAPAPARSADPAVVDSAPASGDTVALSVSAPVPSAPVDWQMFLIGAYVAGVLVLLLRLGIGTVQANRLRRTAIAQDGRLTSDRCTTPITVGWFKPALILPPGWDQWSSSQLAVVLTHEQEHGRRRDPLIQWLALLNRAVFWFHPLAWWLERRLAILAEEACDAVVLAAGHSPQDYSEYLLDMARTVSREHGRVSLVGMAMPGSGLSDRVRLILQGLPDVRISRGRFVCAIAFCVLSSVVFASGTLAERVLQQRREPSPKFDVVSVKPCPDVSTSQTGRGAGPNLAQTSPGHVYWACVTLAALVDQAYAGWDFPLLNTQGGPLSFEPMRGEARDDQKRVRGGPAWMYSERFTIEATASVDVINPPAGAVNLMRLPAPMNRALRAMLDDRFQLKLRRETEERPMYALTVGKGGLKIKPRAPGDCEVPPDVRPPGTQGRPTADGFFEGKWFCSTFSTAPLSMQARLSAGETLETVRATSELNRRYQYRGVTLQKVADQLAGAMDRFVLDKTGVTGEFLLAVEFKSDEHTPGGGFFLTTARNETASVRRPETPTGNGSTIFQAFEALGLKLEPTKGPAEYLAIESVQRPKPDTPRP